MFAVTGRVRHEEKSAQAPQQPRPAVHGSVGVKQEPVQKQDRQNQDPRHQQQKGTETAAVTDGALWRTEQLTRSQSQHRDGKPAEGDDMEDMEEKCRERQHYEPYN